MRYLLPSFALLATATMASPALAVDIGGGLSLSGNAALTSDYRFRGVSFSDEDFALQGGLDLNHDSGFYVGIWGSSIDGTAGITDDTGDDLGIGGLEVDLYGGWSGEISSGTTFDVGILYYLYPDANNNPLVGGVTGDAPTDYWEPYVSISHTLGPVQATVGATYAWKQDALGGNDSVYVYTDLSTGIPGTPLSLTGHVGYTNGSLSVDTDNDYFDYSVGVDYIAGPVSIGVAYIDTDAPAVRNVDATFVGTVSVEF